MSKVFKIPQQVIYVCTGSKCKKKGGKEISKLFRSISKAAGYKDTVEIIRTDCTDRCKFAPVMSFQPQNIWLHDVNEAMAGQLFNQYIGQPGGKTENPSGPET